MAPKPEISTGHSLPLSHTEQTMEITTSQAVATMQKYGGNGVQKLAACWLALDSEKRQRLEQAFEPEFKHYRTMYAEDVKAAA